VGWVERRKTYHLTNGINEYRFHPSYALTKGGLQDLLERQAG